MKKLLAVVLAVLFVASLAACGESGDKGKTDASSAAPAATEAVATKAAESTEAPEENGTFVSWPSGGLFDMLPKPESDKLIINYQGNSYISFEVHDTTQEDYTAYVEKLKAMGFTENEDAQHAEHVFDATSTDGYELKSSVQSVSKIMYVQLSAP